MQRTHLPRGFLLLALLAPLTVACSDSSGSDRRRSTPTASFDSDVAVAWFDALFDATETESLSPPVASRIIGYSGVTAYEAAVHGMPGYRSLAGQLNGLHELPAPEKGRHHWPSVINSALAMLLDDFFASASPATMMAFASLEQQFDLQFSAEVQQEVFDRSVTYGQTLAAAVLAWAADDGYTTWNNCAYTAPVGPGLWEPTPPAFAPPLQPCWGKLRPFVLLFGGECSALPPPTYSTSPTSRFHIEAMEVYDTVNNLTPEQLAIAQFWADGAGTGTPPGHWCSIIGQCLSQQGFTLDQAVQAYALTGIAVADAFIACWDMKFFYNYLRPITYIQDPAGINDPAWTTAMGVGTPPFPEYTSGHSVQSGAAAQVLTDLWGDLAFDDDTHSGALAQRSFTSFQEAAAEAAISRLYGGIHYRSAIERGVDQGRCIARLIRDTVQLQE